MRGGAASTFRSLNSYGFCRVNYGITFPMFAKTSVVGANANPLYRALAERTGKPSRWNFHKYLLTGRVSR